MRSPWIAAGFPLLIAVLLSTPGLAQESGADIGNGNESPSSLYSGEDLLFLRDMSMHHQQAVVMSSLVPARTDRDALIRFARYLGRAQAAEIAAMQSLLDLAGQRGLTLPTQVHGSHGDPPMLGMLSKAQMAALAAVSGAEFERLWLEGMIFHHEGGLAMALAQQLHQLNQGRRPYGFQVLVEDILVEQRAEIDRMNTWLVQWGLSSSTGPDTSAPAAAVTSPPPAATVAYNSPITLIGTAIDDQEVAQVQVAIQDLSTQQWWRSDGTWGPHQLLPGRLTRAGAGSMAWQFNWTPPAAGRYGIEVSAEDGEGNRNAAHILREFSVQD